MARRTPPGENIPLIVHRPFAWRGTPASGSPSSAPTGPGPSSTAWLNDIKKIMCLPEDKTFLADLQARGVTITAFDRIYFEDPYYDGTQWTTRHFEAGGTTDGTDITMIRSTDAVENAATIYHEGVHTGQPVSMAWRDKEYDAYIKEDGWRIAHGLPPHDPSFRTTDASGKQVTNDATVRAMVDKDYPGVTVKTSTGAVEQVIGKAASGETIAKRADGSVYTRSPNPGDSFPAPDAVTEPPQGLPVDLSKLR